MICDLLIIGGDGDLAFRKLYPALYHLDLDGCLPPCLKIVSVSRTPTPPDGFAPRVRERFEAFHPEGTVDEAVWSRFAKRLIHKQMNATNEAELAKLRSEVFSDTGRDLIVYLATPPAIFAPICQSLWAVGLVRENMRIVIEKPLGHDRESFLQINDNLKALFKEEQIYRIDHYLGKETVQNLLAMRFANALFEPLWNSHYIDHVQITAAESVGAGGRWQFYDEAGALRDMVQNHLLHLHDWHASLVAVLRRYMPAYRALRTLPVVYSIHNLSLQGVRPLSGHASSLHGWFPELVPDLTLIQDPHYWDCVNLMRAGITLADRVHAVSPSYAQEILQPTDLAHGFIGGEGLEADLRRVQDQGRLVGILNGCDYHKAPAPHRSLAQMLDLIESSLLEWVGEHASVPAAHFHAQLRVAQWRRRRKPVTCTLTSVGRVTAQKARLLMEPVADGKGGECMALDRILEDLGDGVFVMIGSGDEQYEQLLTRAMTRHDNFLFLRGFSETLADALYAAGDLFLMPSSFEPCGISQMLAMRAGTPCIVHHVGGLRDTVEHGVNGFVFTGTSPREQAEAMLEAVRTACATTQKPAIWQGLRRKAAATRFTWDVAIARYVSELYAPLL